jgi:hypothetical protein
MAVREDCRHYSSRSTPDGLMQRCKVSANEEAPFACPPDCLFIEPRAVSDAGWRRYDDPDEPPGGLFPTT